MAARSPAAQPTVASVASLAARLDRVRTSLLELEGAADLAQYGAQRDSARNLLHYLAFRRFDLRRDQARLTHWGLSSLGRSEGHVLYNLDAVLGWLHSLGGGIRPEGPNSTGPDPERGRHLLARNAQALLGPKRPGRGVRIMVTMPAEAATDYGLVRELVEAGMDCARINCAHEGPADWARMVAHVRRAERATGRRCRIEMDLTGPKIRTGPIRPGPSVLKIRPSRDAFGQVTAPASFWLVPMEGRPENRPEGRAIPVPRAWLARRRIPERVELVDGRGSRRTLRLLERTGDCVRAELVQTVYLTRGNLLTGPAADGGEDRTRIGPIEPIPQRLRLETGDRLIVTARPDPGEGARRTADGRILRLAHIACTLPEGLRSVRPGQSIWFDDGRIGGIVRSATPERLRVEVTHVSPGGTWLGADKGINLPETELDLPALTEKDLVDLRFIVRHADLVGLSFVHTPSDLERLRVELTRLGRPRMGVVLKLEVRRGFDELPGILLTALRTPPVGVMIARGDLAVEVGFERLAEVQEEILWLCEAAHIPAIWATQVLEGLTKSGLPSRAEVTDAAMGERAECVMLNKGPHVVAAVTALDGILRRMQSHQAKKTAMLRHLQLVERFFDGRRAGARARRAGRPAAEAPLRRRPAAGGAARI
ncbi:MAG TPA: pyruvate kinase [Thermoplasmata archaeon]|nr:pyruvate kinase [Thermoplasmata archaeon]